jgi:hypothetical protein
VLPAEDVLRQLAGRQAVRQQGAVDAEDLGRGRIHQTDDAVAVDQEHPVAHRVHQLVGRIGGRDLDQPIAPGGVGVDQVAGHHGQTTERKHAHAQRRQKIDCSERGHGQAGQQQQAAPGREAAGAVGPVLLPVHPHAHRQHRPGVEDEHPAHRRVEGIVAPGVRDDAGVQLAGQMRREQEGGREPCAGDGAPASLPLPRDHAGEMVLGRRYGEDEQGGQARPHRSRLEVGAEKLGGRGELPGADSARQEEVQPADAGEALPQQDRRPHREHGQSGKHERQREYRRRGTAH